MYYLLEFKIVQVRCQKECVKDCFNLSLLRNGNFSEILNPQLFFNGNTDTPEQTDN